MYRILQVLNNNVALVRDEFSVQSVVMGLGLAYKKKKGEEVDAHKIEKIFSIRDGGSGENFMMLLKDVPLDFITVTYDVIDLLSHKYNYPVQEYLYVTLTDHIYLAYKALLSSSYQKGRFFPELKKYELEYKMAQEALAIFRRKLLEDFPDDEIDRIALQFLNAKGMTLNSSDKAKSKRTARILQRIKEELEFEGIVRSKENANFYDRFMIHLRYFLQYSHGTSCTSKLFTDMKEHIEHKYPLSYKIGGKIYDIIAQELQTNCYANERLYITLHIQRLL